MEFRAEMRYLRVSPQKARLVLELIKGRKVEEARNTLLFTKKRVAAHVGKLLQSALDNANFLSAEKESGCRARQFVCEERDRERRSAHEADSSGAAGTGVSLSAAHFAYHAGAGGAREWCGARFWRRRGRQRLRLRLSGGLRWRRRRRVGQDEQEEGGCEVVTASFGRERTREHRCGHPALAKGSRF